MIYYDCRNDTYIAQNLWQAQVTFSTKTHLKDLLIGNKQGHVKLWPILVDWLKSIGYEQAPGFEPIPFTEDALAINIDFQKDGVLI